MQLPRSIGTALSVVVLLTACGGGPAATQGPGGATTNPGGATTNPGGATTNPGGATTNPGGGNVNTANGKAHFEISGPTSKSGDLGFLPIASHFGGMDQTVLNFTVENTDQTQTLTISLTAGGAISVIYASLDITVTGVTCTGSNVTADTDSASGSFECSQTMVATQTGMSMEGTTIKGTFEARA